MEVAPTLTFPNASVKGVTDTVGTAAVPARLTVCVVGLALSVTVSVAVRVPAAVGVKRMVAVQLAPAASVEPQPLVTANSVALVPLEMIEVILSDEAALVFFSVTV